MASQIREIDLCRVIAGGPGNNVEINQHLIYVDDGLSKVPKVRETRVLSKPGLRVTTTYHDGGKGEGES